MRSTRPPGPGLGWDLAIDRKSRSVVPPSLAQGSLLAFVQQPRGKGIARPRAAARAEAVVARPGRARLDVGGSSSQADRPRGGQRPRSCVGMRLGNRSGGLRLAAARRLAVCPPLGQPPPVVGNRTNLAVGQHRPTSLPSTTSASRRRRSSRAVSPELPVSSNATMPTPAGGALAMPCKAAAPVRRRLVARRERQQECGRWSIGDTEHVTGASDAETDARPIGEAGTWEAAVRVAKSVRDDRSGPSSAKPGTSPRSGTDGLWASLRSGRPRARSACLRGAELAPLPTSTLACSGKRPVLEAGVFTHNLAVRAA